MTAIYIAFMVYNWNEERKIQELENVYIESMIKDVNVDIQELDTLIQKEQKNLKLFERLIEKNKDKVLPPDSLNIAISNLAQLNSFSSRNITYESVKSSGKFELLDLNLRIDIIEFYHSGYAKIEEIEGYYKMNFDNQIIPFLTEDAFSGSGGLNKESLKSDRFNTILGLHITFLDQKINAYKNGHRLAESLRNELQEYLNN